MSHDGIVSCEEDIKVVSTCKMDVHKFPFDTQRCNITIGSAMHCGEGGSVCDVTAPKSVLCFLPSPPSSRVFLLSPQLMNSGSFLSPTPLGPRSFPERWWGRRESGSSSSYPSPASISPSMTERGSSSYTLYANTEGPQCIGGQTWVQMCSYRDHWMVWCVMLLPLQSPDHNQPVNDPRKLVFKQHSLQTITWGSILMSKRPVESR